MKNFLNDRHGVKMPKSVEECLQSSLMINKTSMSVFSLM